MTAIETEAAASAPHRRRVRVMFGQHVMATYTAEADLADRYAAAMQRRFFGLNIVVDDLVPGDAGTARPVPCEQLWTTITP